MKTRTKWFLGALIGASVIASIVSGEPRIAAQAIGLYVGAWCVWRTFVFLALLLQPVRKVIEPINRHVDATLRRSGLGVVADASSKLQAGLDGAVAATQKSLDERSKN